MNNSQTGEKALILGGGVYLAPITKEAYIVWVSLAIYPRSKMLIRGPVSRSEEGVQATQATNKPANATNKCSFSITRGADMAVPCCTILMSDATLGNAKLSFHEGKCELGRMEV